MRMSDIQTRNHSTLEYIQVNPDEYFVDEVPPYIETRNEFAKIGRAHV